MTRFLSCGIIDIDMPKKAAPKKKAVKKATIKKVVAKKSRSRTPEFDYLFENHPNLRYLLPIFTVVALLAFYVAATR